VLLGCDGTVRMPRVSGGGGARFHISGVYEKLMTSRSRYRRGPLLDPRLGVREMSQPERDVWEWLQAEGRWKDAAARIAAGEPFEVPRMYFGGHRIPRQDSWPAWLRPHSDVRTVRVYADDTIEPVEVGSDEPPAITNVYRTVHVAR
jgi:hypothetical protein